MILQKWVKNAVKQRITSILPADHTNKKKVAIIFDFSPKISAGTSIANRFAKEGLGAYLVTRPGYTSTGTPPNNITILTLREESEGEISRVYRKVLEDNVAIDAVIVTGQCDRQQPFLEIDVDELYSDWRRDCLSNFYIAQSALSTMQRNRRGTILFTGTTNSLNPEVGVAGASSNRAGVRMLSQSLAREFGPKGIHVAHVVLASDLTNSDVNTNIYWNLYQQHKTAWTQELVVNQPPAVKKVI